jgi:hypothetical protein
VPFINACTRFLYLDDETKPGKGEAKQAFTSNQLKGNTKLMNTLRNAVRSAEDDDGWALLGPVGAHISNQGSIDHRTYGFSKLSDLFTAIDRFEVERTMNGDQAVIRVRIK